MENICLLKNISKKEANEPPENRVASTIVKKKKSARPATIYVRSFNFTQIYTYQK